MWETDSREQTRQQATYNKLEEAVLKLDEYKARIVGHERLLHELRTLPEDEAVRLFWRIRSTAPGDAGAAGTAGGSSSTDPADSESFDWLVGGAGGMSIGEDEYGGGMTHQQQLAVELPPPGFDSAMAMDVGMGEQGQQQQQHHHHHHHQHQQYGEGAYEEGQMYGERHRHH